MLCAVIPAYQAQATLGAVIAGTKAVLASVLVVDDGSTDATLQVAERAGAHAIRLETNRGKGAALRAGFAWALPRGAEAVVTLDADGQHDPREIPRLAEAWKASRAGLVIGSRAHLVAQMSPLRRFGNRFSRSAVSFFAGIPVPDGQSGFRLYDAALLRALPLCGARYELESEVIVKAARAGFRVESVAVRLAQVEGASTSHFRPWRDTARICTTVVRCRFWRPACSSG